MLKSNSLEFTTFDTDNNDVQNEVWDKVFVNLSDFGNYFARYKMSNPDKAPVPTVYGPITFHIDPSALNLAENICISLKSAGGKGFNREEQGIPIDRVEDLFVCIECERPHEEQFIKWDSDLRKEFDIKELGTLTPEVNAEYSTEILPLDFVIAISVDPIEIGDNKLIDKVKELLAVYNIEIRTKNRRFDFFESRLRKEIIRTICANLENDKLTFNDWKEILNQTSDYAKSWIERVEKGGLDYQFIRYVNYLREGTFEKMV